MVRLPNSGPRTATLEEPGTTAKSKDGVTVKADVNQATYLICKGARESAFRSPKSISETLADEIIKAVPTTASGLQG